MNLNLDETLKLLTAAGGVGAFIWGVFVWKQNQKARSEQRRSDAEKQHEQRRLEAQQPFLKLQLQLYGDILEITSIIPIELEKLAYSKDGNVGLEVMIGRFWSLYYGKLAMVEDRKVEAAMINYGDILKMIVQ